MVTDYKHTINLPNTGFPMKADLAQRLGGVSAEGASRPDDQGDAGRIVLVHGGSPVGLTRLCAQHLLCGIE